MWRSNWGIADSPAWYQPAAPTIGASIRTAEAAAQRLWLRVERQTFVRLATSRYVVFTIRTFQQRLADVAGAPQRAADLLSAVEQLPDALADYKAITRYRRPITDWLTRCASGGVPVGP